ncbi:MAG: CvpA family protein [Bacteroidota bacterium]
MNFDFIDIFLIAGLLIGAALGYRAGVMRKLLSLLALIGSIVLASHLMKSVGSFFTETVLLSEPTGSIVGFAVVVLVIMVGIILLYKNYASKGMPKIQSQVFGVILGMIETTIIISLLLLMFKLYDWPDKETRDNSLLYTPLIKATPVLFDELRPYFPGADGFRSELSRTFRKQNIFDEPVDKKKR